MDILNPITKHDWNEEIEFETMDGKSHVIEGRWDLIIAHPPCTYLTNSGNRWFNVEKYGINAIRREERRKEATDFFMMLINANCDKIAVENPIGHMNTHYRKPDQTIQPWQFGHPYAKSTCLWLKNLPLLQPTNILEKPEDGHWKNQMILKDGTHGSFGGDWGRDQNGKYRRYGDPEVAKERSKTFEGIAQAMAEQWG